MKLRMPSNASCDRDAYRCSNLGLLCACKFLDRVLHARTRRVARWINENRGKPVIIPVLQCDTSYSCYRVSSSILTLAQIPSSRRAPLGVFETINVDRSRIFRPLSIAPHAFFRAHTCLAITARTITITPASLLFLATLLLLLPQRMPQFSLFPSPSPFHLPQLPLSFFLSCSSNTKHFVFFTLFESMQHLIPFREISFSYETSLRIFQIANVYIQCWIIVGREILVHLASSSRLRWSNGVYCSGIIDERIRGRFGRMFGK